MRLPIKIHRNLAWVLLLIFVLFVPPSVSTTFEPAIFCDKDYSTDRDFRASYTQVMDVISVNLNSSGWGTHSTGAPQSEVFGLGQCYGDLSTEACSNCFHESRMRINQCLPAHSARIFLDGCYVRFDKYNFFNESVNDTFDRVECGPSMTIAGDTFMEHEFTRKVNQVISNVTESAFKNQGYSVLGDRGGVEGVYALAQCWSTVNEEGCRKCLTSANFGIQRCLPRKYGRALYAGCFLKYSTERFYSQGTEMDVGENEFKIGFIIVGFVSVASLFLLAFFGARLGYMKLSTRRRVNHFKIRSKHSKLNFKYEVLERATDSFDLSRKLGQGGSGSVYMGILPDGKIVAVKRLFFNTRHWVDEFFNEVNLIGGMQHKNLVKLLGCSIEGPESLLVYEYVPYRSLDQILFAKDRSQTLSWKQRFGIILGIAEGLAYLHEGCDVKIIHRDIKTSNILLDENFSPKIADFGLARCITSSRSHISTGIAGTLGYMAPEYLVRGQLTEKVDIYAFGVLILEIACGKKNSLFTRGSNSVLQSVWQHYKEDQITESIDFALKFDFPMKEASTVLQIGLLCTQALVTLRPSMSEVVKMLNNEDCVIPSPRQPPFLNSSVLTEETSRSISMSAADRDGQTCSDVSTFYTVNLTSFSKTQTNDISRYASFDSNAHRGYKI